MCLCAAPAKRLWQKNGLQQFVRLSRKRPAVLSSIPTQQTQIIHLSAQGARGKESWAGLQLQEAYKQVQQGRSKPPSTAQDRLVEAQLKGCEGKVPTALGDSQQGPIRACADGAPGHSTDPLGAMPPLGRLCTAIVAPQQAGCAGAAAGARLAPHLGVR